MREETGTGARRSWPMDMALLWAAGAGSRWDRRGPAGTGRVLLGPAGSCRDLRGPAGTVWERHGACMGTVPAEGQNAGLFVLYIQFPGRGGVATPTPSPHAGPQGKPSGGTRDTAGAGGRKPSSLC